jgi:hypothetical protein
MWNPSDIGEYRTTRRELRSTTEAPGKRAAFASHQFADRSGDAVTGAAIS